MTLLESHNIESLLTRINIYGMSTVLHLKSYRFKSYSTGMDNFCSASKSQHTKFPCERTDNNKKEDYSILHTQIRNGSLIDCPTSAHTPVHSPNTI